MKKTAQLFLPLLLALALLAGCGGGTAGTADTPGPVDIPAPVATPEPEGAVMTARLVEDGLLAEGEDGPYGGTAILTFGVDEDTAITVDGQRYAGASSNYAYAINKNAATDNQIASMLYVKWLLDESPIFTDEGCIPARNAHVP